MKQNTRKAVKHFRGAADNGDADAQYELARRLSKGEGVRKNEAEAKRYFELAAEQGHAEAARHVTARPAKKKGAQRRSRSG